jgi:N-acetyl-alpha-D-glucosaminyl L-malate synthase BshA
VGDVVRIFAQVHARIPAKLLLIGDGPERLFIQQLVKELKLSVDVYFLGEQDHLEPLFFCADLFLLPSEQESFGLTALEAMNCGVPVIASETGGLPEVITHGETGYLYPVGEIKKMAEKSIELLSHPQKHELFRHQARRRAMQSFNANQIIPQYEAYYEEILKA